MQSERQIKEERVRQFAAARGLAGVLLSTPANVAWLTGGGATPFEPGSGIAAASLFVTPDAFVWIASEVEMPRLLAEEVPHAEDAVETVPWHTGELAGIVQRRAKDGRVAADTAVPGTEPLGPEFAALQAPLLPEEIARYRRLGEDAALCMTRACLVARPGLSEHRIAGLLAGDLHAFGITPMLLFVGADERAWRFRHPVPTERRLEEHLLIAVGARRAGLIVAMTRLVHFGPPPDALRRRHDAVAAVDATLHHATRPGARVAEIVAAGCRACVETGFPDACRDRPLGGPTGYSLREARATPENLEIVQPNQSFAWNPAIPGTQSEDTILVTDRGPDLLTATPDLPVLRVTVDGATVERPDILCR